MPTLVRFLIICLIIAGAVYATMLALVTFVDPAERDVTIRIPPERLDTERLNTERLDTERLAPR